VQSATICTPFVLAARQSGPSTSAATFWAAAS